MVVMIQVNTIIFIFLPIGKLFEVGFRHRRDSGYPRSTIAIIKYVRYVTIICSTLFVIFCLEEIS